MNALRTLARFLAVTLWLLCAPATAVLCELVDRDLWDEGSED